MTSRRKRPARADKPGRVDEPARADQLAALKELALERGFNPAKLEAIAEALTPEQLVDYLQESLEAPTLRGRLRRAGLHLRGLDAW